MKTEYSMSFINEGQNYKKRDLEVKGIEFLHLLKKYRLDTGKEFNCLLSIKLLTVFLILLDCLFL